MLEAIILGIIQGVTEFLPVSSTAHLVLFPWFFNWTGEVDTLTFDIALHSGTLFSLLLYFWKDWIDILRRKRRLLVLILCATAPAGIAGFFLNDIVENSLRNPYIICAALVSIGIFMIISEKMYKYKKLDELSLFDSLIIGLSQAIALIPGVSRSGITISTGLFMGLEREAAARFSFLLAMPVIAGATFLHAGKALYGDTDYNIALFSAGFVASTVTGFAAITFLLYFFRKHPLNIFVYYRFLLAVVIIIGVWLKG